MTRKSIALNWMLGGAIVFSVATVVVLAGQQYRALEGATSAKAVFDVRTGDPQKAADSLGLIHRTLTDDSLTAIAERPDFAVVFIGPAVRLISTDTAEFSAEERQILEQIAERLTAMACDGMTLEACLVAANRFGVDPESFVSGVDPVGNGWISLIGYQAKNYSLVPIY
jgi:intracellular sulfur oxidation DsrE/DsrF family protein